MIAIFASADGISISKFESIDKFITNYFTGDDNEEFIKKITSEFKIETEHCSDFIDGIYYSSKYCRFQILINEKPVKIKINYKPSIVGFE